MYRNHAMLIQSRKIVVWTAVVGLLILLVGATCPPPTRPYTLVMTTTDIFTVGEGVLTSCNDPGSVCISFNNQTSVPVQVALYYHNGFDRFNEYVRGVSFECCEGSNPTQPCPCPCPGYTIGECELTREEIFEARNLETISGLQMITLNPRISTLERVQCGDVKTMGVAVAREGVDILANPDYAEGPRYRSDPRRPTQLDEVPCGETIEFRIIDLSEIAPGTDAEELVSLAIQVSISGQ